MTTPVFANSGSIQPAQGGEVACCSIAGGPFAAIDAYVSGGGGAQLEFRLYATVGTLRTRVATAVYSGPPVGAAGQGSVLEWVVVGEPKATNPVVAGGTTYDLSVYGVDGKGAPVTCTLAGTNAYDTAVAQSAAVALPSNYGSMSIITNIGCAQLADVGVDQAGLPSGLSFDVFVSCGAGSVEALAGTAPIGGSDGKACPIRGLPLPVGTQYRLAVRETAGVKNSGNVTASLGTSANDASGGALASNTSTFGPRIFNVDKNSLITGDLSASDWQGSIPDGNGPCLVQPNSGSTSDGFFDQFTLNGDNTAGGLQRLLQAFGVPAGCTSVSLSITMSEPNSKVVRIRIYASDKATVLASQDCACTPNAQTFTITANGLVTNALFWAAIECNSAGQHAAPVCGRATVAPLNATTGTLFAANFLRIRADLEMRSGAYGKEFGFGRSTQTAPAPAYINGETDLRIMTNAARIAASIGCVAGNPSVAWLAGERAIVQDAPVGAGSTIVYDEIALPEALNGSALQAIAARDDIGSAGSGNYITALYVPFGSQIARVEQSQYLPGGSSAVAYGDSITDGFLATFQLLQGWVQVFRRLYPGEVFLDAFSGRSLFVDTNGGTLANELTLAKVFSRSRATDIILAIGVNDYVNANWGAPAFGASYGRVIDAIHAALPNADVWCISPIARTAEAANALGYTLGNYRSEIQSAANDPSRAPWAHFIDGTNGNFPGVGQLVDGTHPNSLGHAMFARAVALFMGL